MPDYAPKPLIFTDLDGTLLDHHTHGYEAAVPVLRRLAGLGSGEEKDAFRAEIETMGLATLQGRRFLHVLGRTDKGRAVGFLRSPEFSPDHRPRQQRQRHRHAPGGGHRGRHRICGGRAA